MLKIQPAGVKRKRKLEAVQEEDADADAVHQAGSSAEPMKGVERAVQSPETSDAVADTTSPEGDSGPSSEGVNATESEDNVDAVSIQSDTLLDQMDED
jgi:hypothetical protein